MKYEIVKTNPVAKFYYRGNRSYPVQRTVLITESDNRMIKGYELRNGNTVVDVENAPIKSYVREDIATADQLRADSAARKNFKDGQSTFKRMSLKKFEEVGV